MENEIELKILKNIIHNLPLEAVNPFLFDLFA